jgi:uncharacterized protein
VKKTVLLFITALFLYGCQHAEVSEDRSFEGGMVSMEMRFFQAAENGNVSELENHIDDGIDINVVDDQGRTAAMIATYANHPEIVKALITRGADIDIQDNMKNNPFLYACHTPSTCRGFTEILDFLVSAEARY